MDLVYKTWQSAKEALAIRCAEHGFGLTEENSYPEAFGSRYVLFRRGPAGIRFIWDGKEEWFLLECTQQIDTDRASVSWEEIALVQFHHSAPRDGNAVLAAIIPAAERLLEGFREKPARPIVDVEGFYRSIRCLAVRLRSEGHTIEADRLGLLISCAWTTGSELIGELALSLQDMKGRYMRETQRLLSECLHFAKHHRNILGLD